MNPVISTEGRAFAAEVEIPVLRAGVLRIGDISTPREGLSKSSGALANTPRAQISCGNDNKKSNSQAKDDLIGGSLQESL